MNQGVTLRARGNISIGFGDVALVFNEQDFLSPPFKAYSMGADLFKERSDCLIVPYNPYLSLKYRKPKKVSVLSLSHTHTYIHTLPLR